MKSLSQQDWTVVRRIPLLAGLSQAGLEALLLGASIQHAPAHTILFLQDDVADRFYAILDGWVKLTRTTTEGEETVIGIFAAGESFAEAAMFDSGRFPVTAEVVAASRLLVVPAGPFLDMIAKDATLAANMLASVSRRLRYLVRQIEQLRAKSAPQRVGNFLLLLSPDLDVPATVQLPYDKSLVAARLGMTPETFSRALAKLRSIGVRVDGNAIVVPEPRVLHRYCNGDS